ncbi:hypothetical protein DXG03_000524 [Asterophora parasitica]|uniref:Uncharacterized protein n=1 Tax=Asterophora parasitica TaxID=117018 RepID=A0A9P7K9Q5_9AGAR|nr:hypothetical protein DXG03_000524 [Asterophora parasitica]
MTDPAYLRFTSLSPDRSCRLMEAKDRYSWVPAGDFICVSVVAHKLMMRHILLTRVSALICGLQMFAKIMRDDDTATLEMTPQAIQAGLLEMAVVATVLLQCGHHID